ncbi:isopenicillin N synthase family dioxygenase [Caulobacter mirabilis]|uniref:2-oxoglutarate-dependent ethylene/succinate-forming enzyme n=1 Tax=Caulobacter mirabilis TaxID=69666 RepID=A0A2D2AT89_9CAUL|nr:2-oxoglutarate and iron-dependent oxygenase domain-containing protein [Caulobacter mirabilis]ATQ41232.1 flavonol synthase [Caulobacter mirabilis]
MTDTLPRPSAIEPVSFKLYDGDFEAFSKALGDSFKRYGFAVISDYDLEQPKIDAAIDSAKRFFALPEETKRQYVVGKGGQRGYIPFGIETAKDADHFDLKEFWHMGRDLPEGHRYNAVMPANVWPAETPDFHEKIAWLYGALDRMGVKVLQAIAHYLNLPRHQFDDAVEYGNSVLRLLHYPPIPEHATGVRAGAHGDINAITLLLGAEEGGLEVKDRDGQWLPINPPPGCLVCNIGDMLERATNNVLPSTIHQVVNPPPERRGVPRYSTPFFLHFAPDYEIKTLPGCATPENPDRYPQSITADDFLMQRLREIKLL